MDILAIIGPGGIIGLASAAISGYVAITNRRTAKAAAEVQGAATVITGYDCLTKSLQARIAALETEIRSLREEQARLRAENDSLREQIGRLEAERDELKEQLSRLQAQMQRRGRPR